MKPVQFATMGDWLRSRGARSIAVLGVASVLLVSVFVATASGSRTGLSTTGGFWSASTPTHSVTSTVYVSAVNCRRVHRGEYVGQRSGAELYGSYRTRGTLVHPFDFAGFFSYCQGHRARYRAEFLVSEPGVGLLKFRPTGLRIAPGDPLRIHITVKGAQLKLGITDVNTHRSARTTGPSLDLRDGWVGGVLPLYGGANGKPYLRGSLRLLDEYTPSGGPNILAGPAPFAPVVYRNFRINGKRLNYRHGKLAASRWRGTAGGTARVTHPRRGAFIVIGKLRSPRVGRTVVVTPVSGTSLIELPGHHHYHTLGRGQRIPNGSKIDARHGQVQITLGLLHGKSETGVFYDGQFQLSQDDKSGSTTATLVGGKSTDICSASNTGAVGVASAAGASASAAGAGASAARASASTAKAKHKTKSKGKKLRSLWANAHGNFTTKGSGGAAAVLGTKWYTEDTCAGTYFKVIRDKLKVTVYYPHVHTVVVTQGHSLFAPNDIPTISLAPLSSSNGRYDTPIGGSYEMTVLSPVQPYYVYAAPSPQPPSGGDVALTPDGSVDGVPRWQIVFHITSLLDHFQDWNVGLRVNGTLYVVKLRVS